MNKFKFALLCLKTGVDPIDDDHYLYWEGWFLFGLIPLFIKRIVVQGRF